MEPAGSLSYAGAFHILRGSKKGFSRDESLEPPEAVAPLTLRNEILLTQYEIRLRRMKCR